MVGIASDALVVAGNQKRSLLGQARPRCHLDDGADGSRTGSGADLTQPLGQVRPQLGTLGTDELELTALRLREDESLEPQHHDRGRQIQELW